VKINAFEIINLIIVMYFALLAKRHRDPVTLVVILFFYGTLHFSFGAVAFLTEGVNFMNLLHTEGGGLIAKFSALLVVGGGLALLGQLSLNSLLINHFREKGVVFYLLLVMAAVLGGYVLNLRQDDWLQLKNVVTIEAMFAFILAGYVALVGVRTYNSSLVYRWCIGGLAILFIADGIGFYEVYSGQSWAATPISTGEMAYRACSILFNPNLFGYWAFLVYLAFAYGMLAYNYDRRIVLSGMMLASVAIYLSGSRSVALLLFGLLFISGLFLKGRLRWLPLIIGLQTMFAVYMISEWIAPIFISHTIGLRGIAVLGERLLVSPVEFSSYVLNVIERHTHFLAFTEQHTHFLTFIGLPADFKIEVFSRSVESIEGRFTGSGLDGGWIVLYQDTGFLGLTAVALAALMSLVRGVRYHVASPGPSSIFALIMLVHAILIGFGIRFQIFPVWMFIACTLICCLVLWWQKDISSLNAKC
jgi:hypothetical protein